TTTVPCKPTAFAIAGYTGRIGAISIPCKTPVETLTGALAFNGASVTAGPCPSLTPIPFGNPSAVPIPGPTGTSGGTFVIARSLFGSKDGKIIGRVGIGAVAPGDAEVAVSTRTITGGFGISGTTTFGAST